MTARALLETANEIDGLLVEFQRDISGEAQRQIYLRVADLRTIASSLAEQPAESRELPELPEPQSEVSVRKAPHHFPGWADADGDYYTADQMRAFYRRGYDDALANSRAQDSGVDEFPERFGCNGPQGTFWTDDAELANKMIAATFDRDEWTVTDTYLPPAAAEQPAKGEGALWPATREEMDAYWAAYSENRANGEGAAIRAGLEAYRACLVGNPMPTPQPSDPADADAL